MYSNTDDLLAEAQRMLDRSKVVSPDREDFQEVPLREASYGPSASAPTVVCDVTERPSVEDKMAFDHSLRYEDRSRLVFLINALSNQLRREVLQREAYRTECVDPLIGKLREQQSEIRSLSESNAILQSKISVLERENSVQRSQLERMQQASSDFDGARNQQVEALKTVVDEMRQSIE